MATNKPIDAKAKFIADIYPHALQASKDTGMSWELMLAQAALETGWGERVLQGTNNIFNIKADKSWQGESKIFNVWEVKNGKKVWQDDAFRVYGNYTEAFVDRIKFLQENPRYGRAGLFDAGIKGDMHAEASALQKAGYATDPNYAKKMVEIFNGPTMRRSLEYAQKQNPELSQSGNEAVVEKTRPSQDNAVKVPIQVSAEQRQAIKQEEIAKIINTAQREVGYREKASLQGLDNHSINAGNRNFTKYARDLPGVPNGQAWCDTFVDWTFAQNYERATARKMLGGEFAPGTEKSKELYKASGAWHPRAGYTPEPGDQIFFLVGTSKNRTVNHTGIVTKVDKEKGIVYTIEGNTSAKPGDREGSVVREKQYALNDKLIVGYGKPNWDLAVDQRLGAPARTSAETTRDQVKTVATANQKNDVRQVQTALNALGYNGSDGKDLTVDGVAGKQTEYAVRSFQRDHGLAVDGKVGPLTQAALTAVMAVTARQPRGQEQGQGVRLNSSSAAVGTKAVSSDSLDALKDLGIKIAAILPGKISGHLVNNLTMHCAARCGKEGLPLNRVGDVSLLQTESGKNMVCMVSKDGNHLVTANAQQGMHVPAEQSAAELSQQQQQMQNIQQQRLHYA